jgi:hypothetical protein
VKGHYLLPFEGAPASSAKAPTVALIGGTWWLCDAAACLRTGEGVPAAERQLSAEEVVWAEALAAAHANRETPTLIPPPASLYRWQPAAEVRALLDPWEGEPEIEDQDTEEAPLAASLPSPSHMGRVIEWCRGVK